MKDGAVTCSYPKLVGSTATTVLGKRNSGTMNVPGQGFMPRGGKRAGGLRHWRNTTVKTASTITKKM